MTIGPLQQATDMTTGTLRGRQTYSYAKPLIQASCKPSYHLHPLTAAGQHPTGEITKFGDIEAYMTKPADYPHSPSKLLLLLSSGTGIHSTNNKLQADKYAAEGYLVIMPDQFGGDPSPNAGNVIPQEASPSFIEKIKMGVAEVAKSFSIDMWLARHTPTTVLPRLYKVIDAIKEDFADAVANGNGIYAAGYCFGGKYVMLLASELGADQVAGQKDVGIAAEEGMVRKGPAIKTGVVAHGTLIEKTDFDHIKAPLGIVAVEGDGLFPDDIRDEGVKKLKEKKVEVETWVYPGVPHGFAVLGEYEDGTIQVAQKQAFDVMLGWLKSH